MGPFWMAAEMPRSRPRSIAFGHKLMAAGAVLIAVTAIATLAARMTIAKPVKQVGLCVLVDDYNRFVDAVIIAPSGDAKWDEARRIETIGSRIEISHPPVQPWNKMWATEIGGSAKLPSLVDLDCPPPIERRSSR